MLEEHTGLIERNDADIPVFFSRPIDPWVSACVILYMDVFGPREELFAMCRQFAEAGYLAVLPNLFNRLGSPVFDPVNKRGLPLDPDCVRANDETSMDMTLEDTIAIAAAAKSGTFGNAPSTFYAIGYCMGGRHALSAVARCPDMRAGISAHGGRLVDETPRSPHLLVAGLDKPFHFYHAVDDETCPDADQVIIEEEAKKAGSHVVSERLAAHHGWSFPERWAYDPTAADFVFSSAKSLFGHSPS